jgi:hypothetical protein
LVRVEHVHVNEGGQALIGNVRKESSGGEKAKNKGLKAKSSQFTFGGDVAPG